MNTQTKDHQKHSSSILRYKPRKDFTPSVRVLLAKDNTTHTEDPERITFPTVKERIWQLKKPRK